MDWRQAAHEARTERRDFDRPLHGPDGRVYGYIPVRAGKGKPPRHLAADRACKAMAEGWR